jgi:hypothetical protein
MFGGGGCSRLLGSWLVSGELLPAPGGGGGAVCSGQVACGGRGGASHPSSSWLMFAKSELHACLETHSRTTL